MLFAFRPKDQKWWAYLDQIWAAYRAAQDVDLSVLPALQVRAEVARALTGRETGPGAR